MIRRHRGGHRDAGETLIELILTVTIISIGVLTVVGGYLVANRSAAKGRAYSQVSTAITSLAEQIKEPGCVPSGLAAGNVNLRGCGSSAPSPNVYYRDCATSTMYNPGLNLTPFPRWKASIDSIEYWNGGTSGTNADWSTTCGAKDLGMQRITLSVTAPATGNFPGVTETLKVVKRRENFDCTIDPTVGNRICNAPTTTTTTTPPGP